jgi:ABC-type uncharacterized transport system auxiliary subunit
MKNLLLAFVCAVLLVGCAPKEKAAQIKEFTPSLGTKATVSSQNNGTKVVKIKTTTAQKIYLGNDMWYKKGSESASYAYNRWAISPSLLVTRAVENSIEETSVFRSVITASSQASSDFVVESVLVDFYQDFSGEFSDAVMSMKVNLISNTDSKLIASNKFAYRQRCKTNDASGGVDAFGEIFGKFAIDFGVWMAK